MFNIAEWDVFSVPVENSLTSIRTNSIVIDNHTSLNSSVNLWSLDIVHHQSLSSSFTCPYSSSSLAVRRINDGYFDCLGGEDERCSSHPMTEPYRYRRQTVLPPQYVSYQQLGNGINECDDGTDEISHEIRWVLFKCSVPDNFACWVFRGDGIEDNRIKSVRLSFHRYCDTIWDTLDGQDERDCVHWTCLPGIFRCNTTGQCIREVDLCDKAFDC
ncbi:unnamed protein product, partial [Rotaria magnacalcarata]